jgi:hypothetical protein
MAEKYLVTASLMHMLAFLLLLLQHVIGLRLAARLNKSHERLLICRWSHLLLDRIRFTKVFDQACTLTACRVSLPIPW